MALRKEMVDGLYRHCKKKQNKQKKSCEVCCFCDIIALNLRKIRMEWVCSFQVTASSNQKPDWGESFKALELDWNESGNGLRWERKTSTIASWTQVNRSENNGTCSSWKIQIHTKSICMSKNTRAHKINESNNYLVNLSCFLKQTEGKFFMFFLQTIGSKHYKVLRCLLVETQ